MVLTDASNDLAKEITFTVYNATFEFLPNQFKRYLQLLRTCKTINKEATPVFFQDNFFKLESSAFFNSYLFNAIPKYNEHIHHIDIGFELLFETKGGLEKFRAEPFLPNLQTLFIRNFPWRPTASITDLAGQPDEPDWYLVYKLAHDILSSHSQLHTLMQKGRARAPNLKRSGATRIENPQTWRFSATVPKLVFDGKIHCPPDNIWDPADGLQKLHTVFQERFVDLQEIESKLSVMKPKGSVVTPGVIRGDPNLGTQVATYFPSSLDGEFA